MVRAAGARCHLWAVHLRIGACTGSPFVQYNKTGTSFEVPVLFEHGSSALFERAYSFRLMFLVSVISMQPGAWVMAKGGLLFMTMDWGVTPQAQNTGT